MNALLQYLKSDKYLGEYFEYVDNWDFVIYKHPIIEMIKLFLDYDAKIDTSILVPTIYNLGYKSYQNKDLINVLSDISSLDSEYLKDFIVIDLKNLENTQA